MADIVAEPSPFLSLPAELVLSILSFLDSFNLINVARTCKVLRTHSYDDMLWQPLVAREIGTGHTGVSPLQSFRELYAAHHPHWFLPRHRIWFSDKLHSGKLLISRYEPSTGCIAAYPVTAIRGQSHLQFWEQDREVVIHSFDPKISLDLDSPVVKLYTDSPERQDQKPHDPDRTHSRYAREISMKIPPEPGPSNAFMLCRALPDVAIGSSTQVWPPLRVPAHARTRNASADEFTSLGHRPTTLEEVSQYTFRVRKWLDFHGRDPTLASIPSVVPPSYGATLRRELWARFNAISSRGGVSVRVPQEITTFATLPRSCYTPTPQKPYQGIWCGDYSGHGCEFLLITQPDKEDERPLPEGMVWLRGEWSNGRPRRYSASHLIQALDTVDILRAYEGGEGLWSSSDLRASLLGVNGDAGPSRHAGPSNYAGGPHDTDSSHHDDISGSEERYAPSGRLEAIKLTGDLNVPRGEYTFIAPDIGPLGLIRVADEPVFRGARVVRSAGHVAGQNFTYDSYTPSQLIMISHNQLAQFWERMGHISYYQRVDLDALVNYQDAGFESFTAKGKRPDQSAPSAAL